MIQLPNLEKKNKLLIFVCSAFKNKLLSESIEAPSQEEASVFFESKYGIMPEIILGPFIKKRGKSLDIPVNMKFSKITKKGIYNDWNVTAFLLEDPKDCAFLAFHGRIDNKQISSPQGTVVVPLSELRLLNDR